MLTSLHGGVYNMFDQIAWPGVHGTQSVRRALTWLAVLKVILVLLINAHHANLSRQNVRSWPISALGLSIAGRRGRKLQTVTKDRIRPEADIRTDTLTDE